MIIKDYMIVSAMSLDKLVTAIKQLIIEDKWQPQGGVAVESFPNGQSMFHQAMVK